MKQTCSWSDADIFDEVADDENVSQIVRISFYYL
jgi:hypothetical protein